MGLREQHGASNASAMNTSITIMPTRAFLLVISPWTKLRLGLRAAVGSVGCLRIAVVMMDPSVAAHTRVEADVEDVHEEVRQQHGGGDGQEQALHERVVEALDGVEELVADAGIREHHLGEHCTTHHEARLMPKLVTDGSMAFLAA
ncbi:hypothetical protein AHiyo8_08850 [Arthrobacter sp. Hiyo8]|nr:hypothetical protein AHiyo8_08850 [Arthrobacter sp. Hiyo8]